MSCTTLVATSKATKDGEVFLLWNFDILRPAKVFFDRFRFFTTKSRLFSYLAWGIPGWLHIPLMNEKGLCFVGNAVGMTDGGPQGTTVFEIIDKALGSCDTVEEVAKLYAESDRLVLPGRKAVVLANMNSMYADDQGGAITIEYSKNHISVRHADESGVMVETNHHQYLDRGLSGSMDPGKQPAIAGSYARLARARELSQKYSGKFDLEAVKRFASDHGRNYSLLSDYKFKIPDTGIVDDSTICCHVWNFGWYLRRLRIRSAVEAMMEGETLYSFILQPGQRTVWYCRGKPCKSNYVPIEFGHVPAISKPLEQRLLRGKTRSVALKMLSLAERAIPVR